jgi:hypothetical protein
VDDRGHIPERETISMFQDNLYSENDFKIIGYYYFHKISLLIYVTYPSKIIIS